MSVDRQKLYESSVEYFDLGGSVVMKLSRNAALEVCGAAAGHDLLIVMIEGGIKDQRGFEARLDAIWKGADPPANHDLAERNNAEAADFIRSQDALYNAFIVTDAPLTGYRHRAAAAPAPGRN